MKKKKYNFSDVSKAFTLSNPGETNELRKRAQLAQATGDISLIMDNKKINLDEIIAGKNRDKDIVSNNVEVNDDTKVKEVNEDSIVVEADQLINIPKDKIKSVNIEGEI